MICKKLPTNNQYLITKQHSIDSFLVINRTGSSISFPKELIGKRVKVILEVVEE